MRVSLFNDVIGPVMRGPSSTHCAAALRIGRLARDLMGGELDEVLVEFDRNGSLPTTHDSQGSDMGLFGGLLGWDADDERLPGSLPALRERGVRIRIETVDAGDPHPNTDRLTLRRGEARHFVRAISTGGSMMEVKAGEFVSEEAVARLNGAFAIRAVKRLAPVPRRSRPRQRGPCAGTDRCRLFPRSMIGPRGSGSCRGWKRSSTPTATADVTGCLQMSRGQGKPRPKD